MNTKARYYSKEKTYRARCEDKWVHQSHIGAGINIQIEHVEIGMNHERSQKFIKVSAICQANKVRITKDDRLTKLLQACSKAYKSCK